MSDLQKVSDLPKEDRQREEDQLREKISSKITVATFLAGFNFTALILVLTLLANKTSLTGNALNFLNWKIEAPSILEFSAILFFFATALFISAVYSYDQLLMPEKFWSLKYGDSNHRDNMARFIKLIGCSPGPRVYTYMLSVWILMFIPATFFSTASILVIFYAVVQFKIFLTIIGITLITLIYYCLLRPRLGPD
jgi:hypothetical protein